MSTLADVANAAGVSKATASRSLRGVAHVSEKTRDKVLKAAIDLDFVATPSASRLATGKTLSIAVVTPYLTRWFFSQVIAGAEKMLRKAGYDVLLVVLHDEATRDEFFSKMPLRRRVDAAILLTMRATPYEVDALAALQVPIVTIGEELPGCSGVRIDDKEAASKATQHLLGLGHRDIAFIGGAADDPLHFSAPVQRSIGYALALEESGIRVRADRVIESDFTVAGGVRGMQRLLQSDPVPTAVFAASDELAIGAISAIAQAGLSVPDDISVIGLDDHELAETFGLSTVSQPVEEQGMLAAQLLLDRLNPLMTDESPTTQTVVPTGLVVRRTTRSPRPGMRKR